MPCAGMRVIGWSSQTAREHAVQIHILSDLRTRLEDADNFKDFKVVAATSRDQLDVIGHALTTAGAGLVDAGHAWISQAWLRAAKDGDAAWHEGFDKMLAFAQSKDWIDENGHIRAHVEWR